MGKFIEDFKAFALKGNVVDMAVGVIIGGAFGKIVSSLVSDVIMPLMGKLTGNVSFTDLKYELSAAVMDGATEVTPAVYLNYGQFIQNILDFIIVAFCIFCMVKALMRLKKKSEEEPAPAPEAPAEPTKEEVLLTEIRDLLKEKK